MTIEEIHFGVRLEYNKIASNHKKSFSDAELDKIINNVIQEYVEIFYSGNNFKRYKLGFEVTQQRIDMLHTLVISQPEQVGLSPIVHDNDIYEFKFSDLLYPYKHHLRSYLDVSECTYSIDVNVKQIGDFGTLLQDANQRPSLSWKRALGRIRKSSTESSSSIYVYSNGEFTPTALYMEYLKKPAEVCLGTYNDIPTLNNPNPGLKAQVDCDLPEDYHHLIVSMAAIEISRILEDVNRLQVRQDRTNNII